MEGLPGSVSSEDALSPRASFQPPLTRHLPSEAWQTHHREHSTLRGVCERDRSFKERLPHHCQAQSAGQAQLETGRGAGVASGV